MSEVKNLDAQLPVYPPYINAYAVEDEISLVDIWIALVAFKKVFLFSLAVTLMVGFLIVTVFITDKYEMNTTISIGKYERGELIELLESPAAVLNKTNLVLLPALTRTVALENQMELFETDVSNPKDTGLIQISNRVIDSSRQVMADFQQAIADAVLAEHLELSRVLNSAIEGTLAAEQLAQQKLKDPRELVRLTHYESVSLEEERMELQKLTDDQFLTAQKKSFEKKIELTNARVQTLNEQISRLRGEIGSQVGGSVQKGQLQDELTDNKLAVNEAEQKRLVVEDRFSAFLVDTRFNVTKQLVIVETMESEIALIESNWKMAIKEKENEIAELKNQLKGNQSRIISLAELSLEPVGLTKNLAYALCVVLSLMGAFFITLIAMFKLKVKEKLAAEA